MTKLISGFAIWFCGSCLLFHVCMVLVSSLGSGRRFNRIVFVENWHIAVPGILFFLLGYRLMTGARLDK